MILVADCSALIALSTCQSLELLEQLFNTVVVPGYRLKAGQSLTVRPERVEG